MVLTVKEGYQRGDLLIALLMVSKIDLEASLGLVRTGLSRIGASWGPGEPAPTIFTRLVASSTTC
jgi:hypothetical protein